MHLHILNIHDISVPPNRQRREFKPEDIVKLADSISQNGLISPVVVREAAGKKILVAGERRLKALRYVWEFGQPVKCGTQTFIEGEVPCLFQGEMDAIDAFEMELEENVRRTDLTWQEKSAATSQLYELRRLQAEKKGIKAPSVDDIAKEIHGDAAGAQDRTRREIILSKHLDDVEVKKAKTMDDAYKLLKQREELKKSAALGEIVGRTFTSAVHECLQGDCLGIMAGLPAESFDVILTDPPYGINAHEFGDSGGATHGAHFYDDSFETWSKLLRSWAYESFRVAKPNSHAYVFCDSDNFLHLRSYMAVVGWNPFRTPLIWHNPTAMRAPWPEHGPQRKWQMCLFAMKGSRNVTRLYPDLVTFPSDENLNHPAQKPVALYSDLLRRSIRPGDSVLDPFCGSGPIFPAAHELKCRAVGIELDPAAYGISIKRIQGLS